MSTTKLYLESGIDSAYDTKFHAKVIQSSDDGVVLDRTLFYPLGGGQNWDEGTIKGPNGSLQVKEVRGRNEIIHKVDLDHQLEIGDEIIGRVKILKKTKTLVFLFCELKCNDEIIASANGIWKILKSRMTNS